MVSPSPIPAREEGWLELRGTDWDKKVRTRLFTDALFTPQVSANPPDSIPLTFMDSLGVSVDVDGHRIRNSMLSIEFDPDASDSSRQSVLDSIGAVAVGGMRSVDGGAYFVWVPSATTLDALYSVREFLLTKPIVWAASMFNLDQPETEAYLLPSEGNAYRRNR